MRLISELEIQPINFRHSKIQGFQDFWLEELDPNELIKIPMHGKVTHC